MSYRNKYYPETDCFESMCPLYKDGCLIAKALLKYIGEEEKEKSKDLEKELNEMKKDIYMAGLGFPFMRPKND